MPLPELDQHMEDRFLRCWNSKINVTVNDVADMIGFDRVTCVLLASRYRKQKKFVTVRNDSTLTDAELAGIWNNKTDYKTVADIVEATGITEAWLVTRINRIRANNTADLDSRL